MTFSFSTAVPFEKRNTMVVQPESSQKDEESIAAQKRCGLFEIFQYFCARVVLSLSVFCAGVAMGVLAQYDCIRSVRPPQNEREAWMELILVGLLSSIPFLSVLFLLLFYESRSTTYKDHYFEVRVHSATRAVAESKFLTCLWHFLGPGFVLSFLQGRLFFLNCLGNDWRRQVIDDGCPWF